MSFLKAHCFHCPNAYLRGQGDLVSILITPASHIMVDVMAPVIPIIGILTKRKPSDSPLKMILGARAFGHFLEVCLDPHTLPLLKPEKMLRIFYMILYAKLDSVEKGWGIRVYGADPHKRNLHTAAVLVLTRLQFKPSEKMVAVSEYSCAVVFRRGHPVFIEYSFIPAHFKSTMRNLRLLFHMLSQ